MLERNSGKLMICLDYKEYLKNFTSPEEINEFLLEISQMILIAINTHRFISRS